MKICNLRLPALALVLLANTVMAAQAYTWTDAEGVTHYSESVPADRVQEAGRIELQSASVIPGPGPDRVRAINEQSARLAAERRKREQARNKRRQIAEKERQLRAYELEDERYTERDPYYWPYPVVQYWDRRPHHRPDRPHRPGKPPHDGRPPRHDKPHRYGRHHAPPRREFRPGKTLTQKHNAEALRNLRHPRYR